MGLVWTHPDYDAAAAEWSRARDVLAGEDAVKAAGPKYLPRLDCQTDDEYAAYKARACFFGATARTLDEYLDLIFRRAPALSGFEATELQDFLADCDRWGTGFLPYARQVVREVLSVGRAGTLVLCDDAGPSLAFYRAEDIWDWSLERAAKGTQLARLVLREGDRLRVFHLAGAQCVEEIWGEPDGMWGALERRTLKRAGEVLAFIPFLFHGPTDARPQRERLPLADIIAANLDHYRLDADYKHGLHYAALPTAWVSGFDKATALRIGASSAWVSEIPGATAGFLEFAGTGLSHLERAMDQVERRMALLGARMLDSRQSELSTLNPQPSTTLCGLAAIVASLNRSLSRVLRVARWWILGADLHAPGVNCEMDTELGARAMSGEEITAVVAAWRAGAISRDSMLARLKRGEVLPDGRSVAQERALIHGKLRAAS